MREGTAGEAGGGTADAQDAGLPAARRGQRRCPKLEPRAGGREREGGSPGAAEPLVRCKPEQQPQPARAASRRAPGGEPVPSPGLTVPGWAASRAPGRAAEKFGS